MNLKEKLIQIISRDHLNDDERIALIHTVDSIDQKTDVTIRGMRSITDFVVAIGYVSRISEGIA